MSEAKKALDLLMDVDGVNFYESPKGDYVGIEMTMRDGRVVKKRFKPSPNGTFGRYLRAALLSEV